MGASGETGARPDRGGSGIVRWWLLLVLVLGATACIPLVLRGDVIRADAGWTYDVVRISAGPNSVQMPGARNYAVPPDGQRFLWVFIQIRNDVGMPRLFGYDSCSMDLDADTVLPAIVGNFFFVMDERNETYRPGEQLYRRLIFAYPRGRLPRALRCGNAVFELPGPGSGGAK